LFILKDQKFIESKFTSEQEIEDVVVANSEHFFGPSSVLIPKAKISTSDGFGTIPDAFAVDLAARVWYVVEAELGHHSVWTHIAPQVSKQILAVGRSETRQLLTDILVQMIDEDDTVSEKFADEKIKAIDIRKVLGEIFADKPIVGMPIDTVSNDLRDWVQTLRNDVRLWIVKKYVLFRNQEVVAYEIPEEYRPILDTTGQTNRQKLGRGTYDVCLADLMQEGYLEEGDHLSMSYGPRGKRKTTFRATLGGDGSLSVGGDIYSSLSYAALACMQSVGSDRTTVNGWTKWRRKGRFLSDVRDAYLQTKAGEEEQAPI